MFSWNTRFEIRPFALLRMKHVISADNIATREGYDRILRCTGFKVSSTLQKPDFFDPQYLSVSQAVLPQKTFSVEFDHWISAL